MNLGLKLLGRVLIWPAAAGAALGYGLATAGFAAAQDAAPAASSSPSAAGSAAPVVPAKPRLPSSAQADAGEPRADTSAATGRSSIAPAAPTPVPPVSAGTVRPPARTAAHAAAPTNADTAKPAGQKAPGTVDRLDLSTATVTGDQEQPKVMYVVPWKRSDIGDLSGKPMNSLLDEALAPVDRDEFKREVAYYGAVRADASQNGAAKAAKQGEK